MRSPQKTPGVIAVAVLSVAVWLVGSSLLKGAKGDTQPPVRNCAMDPVEQSICIYEALLADVAKTYKQRGGGGISSIAQKSTTTFDVQIAQEGRKDILTYTIEVAKDGKVKIVGKAESTKTY